MALFKPLERKLKGGKYIELFIDGIWACDENEVPLLFRKTKTIFTDEEGKRWRLIKSKRALKEYKRHQRDSEKQNTQKKAG